MRYTPFSATWFPTSDPLFEDGKPHTLADFVAESIKRGVRVEGLPAEVKAGDAAKIFGAMRDINLKPLPFDTHYFHGWFPLEGTKVETVEGIHLFTVNSTELLTKGFRLIVEPPAVQLLLQNLGQTT